MLAPGEGPRKPRPSTTLAQAIPMCTVMFAAVTYDVAALADFDFLSHLFSAWDRAVELSGVHGARVLVPDAHVSLRVRPCCDVMVAHLRVWQHFSIDHPVYGRYSTAVHIS